MTPCFNRNKVRPLLGVSTAGRGFGGTPPGHSN